MPRLKSWKAIELRELSAKFRKHAGNTHLPKYIELLRHTADVLEREAEALEDDPAPSAGRHLDIYA